MFCCSLRIEFQKSNLRTMNLQHKALVDLLRMAYSAEEAAAFAYQGHAASVKSELKKAAIKQIEIDEWNH
jgi:hypothetical protein